MAPLRLLSSVLHTMRRLQQSLLCMQTFLARTRLALLYSCTWWCPGVSRGSSPTSLTEVFWVLWSYLPWTANRQDRWVHLCKTSTVWQLEIHVLCCRAILWESHCWGLSVPSLLQFLVGTVCTFLVRWVTTTWGWSHLSLSFISISETSCSFVSWRYDRLRVSVTYKYFPGMQVTYRSYFCSCSRKHWSLTGAWCSGLLKIDCRDLWSVSTSTVRPYTNWWNFSHLNTTASVSFSICA